MATSGAGSDTWRRATSLQRAMILSSLKADAPGAYHQQLVVRLREKIDPALFPFAPRIYLRNALGIKISSRVPGRASFRL